MKLITVTRADLSAGYQTVQSVHAMAEFAYEHPEIFREWRESSNYLAALAVKDLEELYKLCDKLDRRGITYVPFLESDINEFTAIAIEPTVKAKKACSSIGLANRINGIVNKNIKSE